MYGLDRTLKSVMLTQVNIASLGGSNLFALPGEVTHAEGEEQELELGSFATISFQVRQTEHYHAIINFQVKKMKHSKKVRINTK